MKKIVLSLALIASLFGDEMNEDFGELDGFSDGFEESVEVDESSESSTEDDSTTFSGNLALKTSASPREHKIDGVEYQGINQAQMAFYLQYDSKLNDDWKVRVSADAYYDTLYGLKGYEKYNSAARETYEKQLRVDDAYVEGSISSSVDLKVGRQIVVWGKSDTIRITDVINPLDNRLPGMTDIEDLRLSTTMAKLDYYVGDWDLSAMIIAEPRTFLEAKPRSEFFPVDEVFKGAPNPFIPLDEPETSTDNLQYAFAANGVFSGWDISFYAANVFDSKWHFNQASKKREISKISMAGTALNVAVGSWLIKSEVAFIDGVKYNTTTDEKQRLDALVGFDYMGVSDTVISLEVANRHIFDYESKMNNKVGISDYVEADEMQSALRISHTLLNDTLSTNALLSIFGSELQNGGFARAWLEYDILDAMSTTVGYIDYIGGDKPFLDAIKKNDRFFADITYSF